MDLIKQCKFWDLRLKVMIYGQEKYHPIFSHVKVDKTGPLFIGY